MPAIPLSKGELMAKKMEYDQSGKRIDFTKVPNNLLYPY